MAIDFKYPYAQDGDRTQIPDDTQVDGTESWQQGRGNRYQLNPETDPNALRIERAKDNYYKYAMSLNVKEFVDQGIPNHISGKEYLEKAKVRFDGNDYIALTTTTTTPPSADWDIDSPIVAGTGLQKSGSTLNFYPFGLTTATNELTTNDYVVVSDSTTPKKITLENLMVELAATTLFQNSKNANGYMDLPNGMTIQWGTTTSLPNNSSRAVTLPIAFSNTPLSTCAFYTSNTNGVTLTALSSRIISSSQIVIEKGLNGGGASDTATIGYMAIGY